VSLLIANELSLVTKWISGFVFVTISAHPSHYRYFREWEATGFAVVILALLWRTIVQRGSQFKCFMDWIMEESFTDRRDRCVAASQRQGTNFVVCVIQFRNHTQGGQEDNLLTLEQCSKHWLSGRWQRILLCKKEVQMFILGILCGKGMSCIR